MKISPRSLSSLSTVKNLLRFFPVFLLAALTSCSPKAPKADVITILGSNTFGEELAPKLIFDFKKTRQNVDFDTTFKGTSYGIGALMVDKCDIAAASREITTNELSLAKDRSIEFNDYVIGSYAVAVVVHAGNPLSSLSRDQVRDLFTGKVQNWKDVGGPDLPVHLYIRDPVSGTYLGFQELAMDKKEYAQHPKTFASYDEIVKAVAQDPSGIGYASIEDGQKPGIKAVSIGNAVPTIAAVEKGEYPYARVLRLYTNKAKENPVAMEFIQFIQSKDGQKALTEMGFVPKS
jgi:phosphate transport system substrate-binding protein